MARGRPLSELLNEFRGECKLSLNPANNSQTFDSDVLLLQNVQRSLYENFNWPHLRVRRDVAIQAGQRYFAPPADIHIDRIERIQFRYGIEWLDLTYGIGPAEFSMWDSDKNIASWPVERWQLFEGEQIEVWPIPASNQDPVSLDGTLRFIGIRDLKPMVAMSDLCELDSDLIVFTAAGERLTDSKSPRANLVLKKANTLYAKRTGQLVKTDNFQMFRQGPPSGKHLRGPPRVQYVNVNRP